MTLRSSGEVLRVPMDDDDVARDCATPPMLVIANYVFDSLTVDAFRVSSGVIEQARVGIASIAAEDKGFFRATRVPDDASLTASTAPSADATKGHASFSGIEADLLRRMILSWSYSPVAPVQASPANGIDDADSPHIVSSAAAAASLAMESQVPPASRGLAVSSSRPVTIYGDAVLDALLSAYAATPSLRNAASILVPLGGCRALRTMLGMSRGRLVALVGDKGYARLDDMEGHRYVHH